MVQRAHKVFTPKEYLAQEEAADTRSEFFRGEIFAMSGGTPAHNTIVLNVGSELRQALRKSSCQAFVTDQRVLVENNGLYTYPDAMVVCGDIQLAPGRKDTITNPILIVEVLSESTRDYDRGDKFKLYRTVPTLQHYILADQDEVRVEYYRKHKGDWVFESYTRLSEALTIKLGQQMVKLRVRDLYDKVEWST